jgi:hypothetical protein
MFKVQIFKVMYTLLLIIKVCIGFIKNIQISEKSVNKSECLFRTPLIPLELLFLCVPLRPKNVHIYFIKKENQEWFSF